MSLKRAFAKTLNRLGLHPAGLLGEQMRVAVAADDSETVKNILAKDRGAAALYVRRDDGNRGCYMLEFALGHHSFGAAATMAQLAPEVMTRDYSHGEDFIRRSILMQRVIMGDDREVEFLIGQKADVAAKDDEGATALHFAAGLGKHEAAEALLKAGADVNAPAKNGVTPLMEATKGDSSQMVRHLLGKNADIHACAASGMNAVMHAIHNQNIAAAQLLMENGGQVLDQNDPAVDRIRRVAEHEAEWDFIRLLNNQYDVERNRIEDLAKMTMKEICETGTAKDIRVRPIRLKGQAP